MSYRPARAVGLQMALDRRKREDEQKFYFDAARDDAISRQKATFETRTKAKFNSGELKRRAKVRMDKSKQELDSRRAELASLFFREDQNFKEELAKSIETPESRRARLTEELNTIRQRRKDDHDKYVNEKLEQAWRDNCDPLRHQISEALERKVIAERNVQVAQKEIAKMSDDIEDENYVAAVKEAKKQYYDRIAEENGQSRMKVERNKEVWNHQIDQRKKAEDDEKQKEYQESLEFRTTIEGAKKKAEEAAKEKAAQQAARRKELDQLNSEQISKKNEDARKEREFDVAYAQKAKDEARQQEEESLVAKLVAKRRTDLNRELLATQLNRKKAAEDEAEKFIRKAQKETEEKEDAERSKQEEQRRRLMLDAVTDRVRTIQLHEQQKEKQRDLKEKEREEMLKTEEEVRQQKMEEWDAKQRLIKNQYDMLHQQTILKARIEEKRKQDEVDSVKQMVDGWKMEEKRIKEALANPQLLAGNRFRGLR